jgi:hypothetical protein
MVHPSHLSPDLEVARHLMRQLEQHAVPLVAVWGSFTKVEAPS